MREAEQRTGASKRTSAMKGLARLLSSASAGMGSSQRLADAGTKTIVTDTRPAGFRGQ